MRKLISFILIFYSFSLFSNEDFYQIKAQTIRGEEISFSAYKGKTVLVVNIASRCGYTPQLEGLQQLFEKYRNNNFVIVGVPSNEFGGQTPEENEEMAKFCKLNYGVNFPLLSKATVKGDNKHPLFKYLLENSPNKDEISWNFEKFLIDPKGKVINRFKSGDSPLGDKINDEIKKVIN